ncbi:hypothetical protein [Tenacibaculum sp. SG-28]|uniref:hypothetical protein n=1 Tax=Tenacibaculum sp. SG-28 TaxID=754426 RepID=UPI000CF5211C|nr:hypothetical protein [Tenacibaculum sp. SG-28]PQJ20633.1 hypothetical protein BSU00_10015 [Tenacibaculum sp. SG-28]
MSSKDKIPSDASIVAITSDKETYKPGEEAILKVKSGAKSIYVMVEISRQDSSVSKHYLHLNRNHKQINIPISAQDMGGIHVNWYYVAYNSFAKGSHTISVPFPKKDLEITTNTFRDKLVPGSQETWRFTIKGSQKEPVSAEVLASMYDASLDAFEPHQWRFSPISKPQFRGITEHTLI